MSRSAVLIIIILVSLAALVIGFCGGVGFVLFVGVDDIVPPPENIQVSIDAPDQVAVGDAVQIVIRVKNSSDSLQVLDSIDTYEDYYSGIKLTKSNPPWQSSSAMFGLVSYDYQLDIPAHDEVVVTFEAQAISPGDYFGDFDICINNEMSFVSHAVRTVVVDKTADKVNGE